MLEYGQRGGSHEYDDTSNHPFHDLNIRVTQSNVDETLGHITCHYGRGGLMAFAEMAIVQPEQDALAWQPNSLYADKTAYLPSVTRFRHWHCKRGTRREHSVR